MIKAGQIYESNRTHAIRVITYVDRDTEEASTIFYTGLTYDFPIALIKEWKLIAEYPTWREAVNSKEFTE